MKTMTEQDIPARPAWQTAPGAAALFTSLVLAAVCTLSAPARDLDFAPLFATETDEFDRRQWLAAGPLFERTVAAPPGQESKVVTFPRPFYSSFSRDGGRRTGWDFLWPLALGRSHTTGSFQYALLFLHTKRLGIEGKMQRERWWLLPFFFYQRDSDGDSSFGVFPIGGRVDNVAGYDRSSWILFPVYGASRKGETRSRSVLWPIFAYARGPQLFKWRIFPVYGMRRTPRALKRFVLWPFIHTTSHYSEDRGRIGGGFLVVPLVGYYRVRPEADTPPFRMWTFLWPFFSKRQQGENFRLHFPWPFYQHAETYGKEGKSVRRYFWPVYGHSFNPNRSHRFFMWPFVQSWKTELPGSTARQFWLLPYWSTQRIKNQEVRRQTRHVWPLVGYVRKDAHAQLWAPALWPRAQGDGISRNYAPLWRLYTFARDGETRRHQLLWGLWQYESGPEHGEVSLFPLFELEHDEANKNWALLKGLIGRETCTETGISTTRVLWFLKW